MPKYFFLSTLLWACAAVPFDAVAAQPIADGWPKRVLITNDDGIDDPKIQALAEAFAQVAETVVAAPSQDRSSTTNYISAFRTGQLRVESRSIGEGIRAYAVDGFPADCVVWALGGLLREKPPDLVVSGINGGPNLGQDWFGSGTVGAARTAAYAGFPAIAVSGLDDTHREAVAKVTRWIVKLARSDYVRALKPGQYLTVSVPRVSPGEIKGIKVTRRAGIRYKPFFEPINGDATSKESTWRLKVENTAEPPPPYSDIAAYAANYIVVVPMLADEHDDEALRNLANGIDELPAWP
jgi:5'-nucleotidase